jgi:hypothetical protein
VAKALMRPGHAVDVAEDGSCSSSMEWQCIGRFVAVLAAQFDATLAGKREH